MSYYLCTSCPSTSCCDISRYCATFYSDCWYYSGYSRTYSYSSNYYYSSQLASSAKIGIGVGVSVFAIIIIVIIAVICCRRRRMMMNGGGATTIAMGAPAMPMAVPMNNMNMMNNTNMGLQAPPAYAGGVPFDNRNSLGGSNTWGNPAGYPSGQNLNNIGGQIANGYPNLSNNF